MDMIRLFNNRMKKIQISNNAIIGIWMLTTGFILCILHLKVSILSQLDIFRPGDFESVIVREKKLYLKT